jgi:hypothetical protein
LIAEALSATSIATTALKLQQTQRINMLEPRTESTGTLIADEHGQTGVNATNQKEVHHV